MNRGALRAMGASTVVFLLTVFACSSTSTNESSSTGGGGGAPACDSGPECYSCCRTAHDDGAYLWAVKQCVCGDAAGACQAICCTDPIDRQACSECAEGNAAGCVSSTCAGDGACQGFRACLGTCL